MALTRSPLDTIPTSRPSSSTTAMREALRPCRAVATVSRVSSSRQVGASASITSPTVAPTALRRSSSNRCSDDGSSRYAPNTEITVGMCNRVSWTMRSSSSSSPTTTPTSSTTGAPPSRRSESERAASSTVSSGRKVSTSVVITWRTSVLRGMPRGHFLRGSGAEGVEDGGEQVEQISCHQTATPA